jgi:uncharacterized phage-like protein YoqJ
MNTIGEKIIAVTGHRPNKLNNEYNHNGPISEAIKAKFRTILLDEKPAKIISGMALGVDTLYAMVGLELQIPIIAAVPFLGQERMWPQKSKDTYFNLLNDPLIETYIVSEGGYAVWKMQARNEWMVNHCTKLIGVWDGTTGGTGNCVRYAKKVNRELILINPIGVV